MLKIVAFAGAMVGAVALTANAEETDIGITLAGG